MHRVIVYKEGHAKDIHWQIGRQDEEDALLTILIYWEYVVFAINFNPLLAELEINRRVITIAGCIYDAILE